MTRRPVVTWDAPGRPTARQSRAIAAGLRSGAIRPGDHVGPAPRRNPSTAAASAFREFHWGRDAKRRRVVQVPADTEFFQLGRLRAVEYETRKGRKIGVWRHEFGPPYPALTGTADGRLGPIVGGAARITKRGIEG